MGLQYLFKAPQVIKDLCLSPNYLFVKLQGLYLKYFPPLYPPLFFILHGR